jgi:demethylmenaquinone methyltransferase/2-methoxy-6-polyprenyl-1,4-benzoquinol methylase
VPADRVTFGYRKVTSTEKKRLVHAQLDPIARTYDLADTLLSFGLDSLWRKHALRLPGLRSGDVVLDACGGTAGPSVISFVQGDAEQLSFPDRTFDAVTVGFGLRNLVHPENGLEEFLRVLKPGGKLMILEFSLPTNRLLRDLYHFYSFYWMPFAGRLICGAGTSFRYFAESIRVFPTPDELAERMRHSGFSDVRFERLSNGIAVAYLGVRPALSVATPALSSPSPAAGGDR